MRCARAAFLSLLLTLSLCACAPQAPLPSDPAPAESPAPALAFLGSSESPWSQELSDGLSDWCAEEGWTFVEYDCKGYSSTQALQAADLARFGADAAVVCPTGAPEDLAAWGDALAAAGIPALAVTGRATEPPEEEDGLCRVAATGEEFLRAAGETLSGESVVLLHSVEDTPLEAAAPEALAQAGVKVLGRSYTWGSAQYAQTSLTAALRAAPGARWVVCFSRAGARAARAAIEDLGREDEARILCLAWDGTLRELDEAGVDALAAVSAQDALEAVRAAIPKLRRGEAPAFVPLTARVLSAPADGWAK